MMYSKREKTKKKKTHFLKPKSSHQNLKNSKNYQIPAQGYKKNEQIFFDSTNLYNLEDSDKNRKKGEVANSIFPKSVTLSSHSDLDWSKLTFIKNNIQMLDNFNTV